jgi:hypothetical protein
MWHPKWRTQHLKNNIGSDDAQLHQGNSAQITETITVRERRTNKLRVNVLAVTVTTKWAQHKFLYDKCQTNQNL